MIIVNSKLPILCLAVASALAAVIPQAALADGADGEKISYGNDVHPILAETCFHCHGPDPKKREGGVRLDTSEGFLAKSEGRAIVVPGDPENSLLYQLITSKDEEKKMPPPKSHRFLTEKQIATVRQWIVEGAPWEGHWAYQPIKKPTTPAISPPAAAASWSANAIDHFTYRQMQKHGMKPSKQAVPATLARRLALDLTGLPLRGAASNKYITEPSEAHYEAMVDELLASPHFGERMAFKWMEVSRFAESDGYQLDQVRTQFPWRDWVIKAYNSNKKYDQFVVEQLAGDLLPNATQDQILATGFNRNHMINGEGGANPTEFLVEIVADRVETTGTAFLGLTMGCARCHDHKYDPITQKDFFSMFAYFNNVAENGKAGNDAGPFLNMNVSPEDKKLAIGYQDNVSLHRIKVPGANTVNVAVMKERGGKPRDTHVLLRGVWDDLGEKVGPATPGYLPQLKDQPKNRLGLASWIVSKDNPLTARVAVNRMWELYFGRGIVKTQEDFGVQSARRTHPELLDWLAADFLTDWDVKRAIKQMLMSQTYRQQSRADKAAMERDPENKLLTRASRFRYPSWVLRDQALSLSGLLSPHQGGASVRPYQPPNIWLSMTSGKARYEQHAGEMLYRRSLYTFWRRTATPVNLFDAAQRRLCDVSTRRTNTPLHALTLMNDVTYVEAARSLADKLLQAQPQLDAQVEQAFQQVLFRNPTPVELTQCRELHKEALTYYQAQPADAAKLITFGESKAVSTDAVKLAALTQVITMILNTDESLNHQ